MQNRLPLEEINQDLRHSLQRLEGWSKETAGRAKKLRSENKENQEACAERQAALDAERDHFQKQASALKERLDNEQQEQEQAKEAAENAAQEAERAQACWKAMQTNIQEKSARLSSQEKSTAEELKAAESNLDALRAAVQLFQDRLGLQLAESEDLPEELLLIFTCISERQPRKEYIVGVQVNGGLSYQVTRCEPAVEQLAYEVDELQKSGNFARFVLRMRQHFCSLQE